MVFSVLRASRGCKEANPPEVHFQSFTKKNWFFFENVNECPFTKKGEKIPKKEISELNQP